MPIAPEPLRDTLIYRVDAHDRITFVNDRWDTFARTNGAAELLGVEILGRRMPEFIGDVETLHLYGLLTRRARQVGGPLVFRFRCDAPDAARSMQMRIELVDGGEIEFRTGVLEIRPRPAVAVLLAGGRRDPSRVLRLCSWCNRGEVNRQWLEIERVVVALELFEGLHLPRITHGVCADCHDRVLAGFLAE